MATKLVPLLRYAIDMHVRPPPMPRLQHDIPADHHMFDISVLVAAGIAPRRHGTGFCAGALCGAWTRCILKPSAHACVSVRTLAVVPQ